MLTSNPFSQLRSSTNGFFPPNSFFYHEKDDVHYNSLIISDDFHFHAYTTSAPPPVLENVATIHQDFVWEQQISENHADLLDSVISGYKKRMATSKKDGRSKIYTARGPRDRRVRLSIDIARKFFCLQELLGFDKASETLDWLLSKSLTAIKELVEEKSHASSSTVTDQSKATFLETIYNGGSVEDNAEKNKCVNGKKGKTRPRCKSGFQENFIREQLRADARARARERTREKLRVKNLDDDLKTLVPNGCESGFWDQNERPYI